MNEGASLAAGFGLGGSLLLLGMSALCVCTMTVCLYVWLVYDCCADRAAGSFGVEGPSLSVPGTHPRLHDERHMQTLSLLTTGKQEARGTDAFFFDSQAHRSMSGGLCKAMRAPGAHAGYSCCCCCCQHAGMV